MKMSRMMGLIFAVVLVVVGLVLFPIVMSQVASVRADTNIEYFTGTQALIDLVPLLYTVGVLGLAGIIAVQTMRGSGKE